MRDRLRARIGSLPGGGCAMDFCSGKRSDSKVRQGEAAQRSTVRAFYHADRQCASKQGIVLGLFCREIGLNNRRTIGRQTGFLSVEMLPSRRIYGSYRESKKMYRIDLFWRSFADDKPIK